MHDRMPDAEAVQRITDAFDQVTDGHRAIDALAAAQDIIVIALSQVATDLDNALAIWEHMKPALTEQIQSDFKKHKAIQRAVEKHLRDKGN